MAEITLYVVDGSCSFASHAALEYAGADYEAVYVDFQNEEQRSEKYLAVNPKGRVPALVSKRGTLTGSGDIAGQANNHHSMTCRQKCHRR